jgi:hypothetical protein
VTVRAAEHVELVIEVDDRVSGVLTAGPKERRDEYHRPQHCQDEQDRQRLPYLSTEFVVDEGNND